MRRRKEEREKELELEKQEELNKEQEKKWREIKSQGLFIEKFQNIVILGCMPTNDNRILVPKSQGLPGWLSGKELALPMPGFNPWFGKIP